MPRPKENRETMLCQVAQGNKAKFQEIAEALGYLYGGKGSQGKLIDAICAGELILIKSQSRGLQDNPIRVIVVSTKRWR